MQTDIDHNPFLAVTRPSDRHSILSRHTSHSSSSERVERAPKEPAHIEHLDRHSSRLIAATLRFPSIGAILEALLWNSLEAGAKKVDVWLGVSPPFGSGVGDGGDVRLEVQDDGEGIGRWALDEVGEWSGDVDEENVYEGGRSQHGELQEGGSDGAMVEKEVPAKLCKSRVSLLEITTCPTPDISFAGPNQPHSSKKRMASDITHAHGTRQSPYRSSALTFSTPSSHVCRKVIKGGKTLFCGPAKRSFGRDRGTTVTVRDIFHNVPVRQRVLLSSPSAALAQCKRVLETMALVHPGVQWNMWEQRDDAMKGMKGEAKHILGVSALCTRSIDVFRELYGRAGVERVQSIRVSSGRRRMDGFISLEGSINRSHQHLYINHRAVPPGDLQAIISKKFASSQFSAYAEDGMDDAFPSSARKSPRRLERYPIYVLNILFPDESSDLSPKAARAASAPRHMPFDRVSGAGPMAANANMDTMEYERVKRFIGAVIDEFLARHGFLYTKAINRIQGNGDLMMTSSPGPLPSSGQPITSRLSHLASGKGDRDIAASESSLAQPRGRTPLLLDRQNVTPVRPTPHLGVDRDSPTSHRPDTTHLQSTQPILATHSGDDALQGRQLPATPLIGTSRPTSAAMPNKRSRYETPVKHATPDSGTRHEFDNSFSVDASGRKRYKWIEDITGAVDSGLLPYTPRTLPDYEHARDLGHGCDSTLRLQGDAVGDGSCTTCCADPADAEIGDPSTEMPASRTRRQPDRYFTQLPGLNLPATRSADHPSMRPTDVSFTPEAIASAKVIQQVDRKFVACVMQGVYPAPRPEGSRGSADSGGVQGKEVAVLVLVDQHAADERVSVEPMTEELCTGFVHDSVDTTSLSDIGVVLTQEECGMLQSEGVVDILHRWGIQLDLTQTGEGNNDYVQVGLSAVPTVLKARLGRKEGKEMTRLLKVYLPFLVENIGQIQALLKRYGPAAEKAGGQCVEMVDWTALIRWMPLEMVELVNSKACRNAIMFGDSLTINQCERLIGQLGQTRHPFICAHGRPTTVPLLVLPGRENGDGPRRVIDWQGWMQAYT